MNNYNRARVEALELCVMGMLECYTHGGMTIDEIATRLCITSQKAYHVCKQLEEDGAIYFFVSKRPMKRDKKAVSLALKNPELDELWTAESWYQMKKQA